MNEDEINSREHPAETALYEEYRDVIGQFKYFVETERRVYLANSVEVVKYKSRQGLVFRVFLEDVWVWDFYRSDKFLKSAQIITQNDINIEELNHVDIKIPDDLSLRD
ncbi:DUF2469 domain-containing protein [Canibacter sp. lx-72]|uniref:DUF2469 family protein n=1 Tax=Canibacter zhuwentaonis TaxID=2837491 RepID=UPI001BDC5222|nr:DUF2469 family protein [Canibacter zhuwentaonis]MBT1017672.1 DUF2469 domain-containing protein [Canibacter zhuwentaonis]MBT1034826.1 DUF2469 domain-containing protein [Canibacter zhuwentaonis]